MDTAPGVRHVQASHRGAGPASFGREAARVEPGRAAAYAASWTTPPTGIQGVSNLAMRTID
jgi:hypothetical protein